MKTLNLGRDGKTPVMLMNRAEFEEFMKDKTVYHQRMHWIERWNQEVFDYFPYAGFIIESKYRFRTFPYAGYSKDCLDIRLTSGECYWQVPTWKVAIRKTKSDAIYYVTPNKVGHLIPDSTRRHKSLSGKGLLL